MYNHVREVHKSGYYTRVYKTCALVYGIPKACTRLDHSLYVTCTRAHARVERRSRQRRETLHAGVRNTAVDTKRFGNLSVSLVLLRWLAPLLPVGGAGYARLGGLGQHDVMFSVCRFVILCNTANYRVDLKGQVECLLCVVTSQSRV